MVVAIAPGEKNEAEGWLAPARAETGAIFNRVIGSGGWL